MSWRPSQPGGIFGEAPEARVRARVDGMAGGRHNSSSLVGGLFGTDPPPQKHSPGLRSNNTNTFQSSVCGGIFGGGAWSADAAGRPPPPPQQHQQYLPQQLSARGDDDFLDRLDEAERHDEEEAEYLRQLAADEQIIIDAAAQIADEQGLSPEAHDALLQRMRERLHEQREASAFGAQHHAEPHPPPPMQARQPQTNPHLMASSSPPQEQWAPQEQLYDGEHYGGFQNFNTHTVDGSAPAAGGFRRVQPMSRAAPARGRGVYNRQPPIGDPYSMAPGGGDASAGSAWPPPSPPQTMVAGGGQRAAGGRSANSHHCLGSSPSGHHRNPNASSIAGGIFG